MTLDQRILDLTKKYMKKLAHKKVLTTMEEVEASTNETNLVAAPVVAELNNKLGEQPQWITDDATGKITGYKTAWGADTVFPFNDQHFMPEGQSLLIPKTSTLNDQCRFCVLTFGKKIRLLYNGKPSNNVYFSVQGISFISNSSPYISSVINTDLIADNGAVFVCNYGTDPTVMYNKTTGIVEHSDECDVVCFAILTTGYALENFTIEWLDE